MLWTCQKCQNQNAESSKYCQVCGERKPGEKPLKVAKSTMMNSTPQSKSSVTTFKKSEQSFNHLLRPMDFGGLETYSLIAMVGGVIFYLLAIVLFFVGLAADMGFIASLSLALIFASGGFTLQLIAETINLLLQGQESWYLTAKYSYVNSRLTDELINRIQEIETNFKRLHPLEQEQDVESSAE